LDNVIFLPPQSHDMVPSYIKTADVCLVHLAKIRLYEITIPSKTYEYMAMGKPLIMAVHGEASSLIRRHDCGLTIEPEDPELLKAAILTLANHPKKAKEFGRRARKASVAYSELQLTTKYQEIIQTCNTLRR
jgi:colanic acid biosynthesis glycosyl transferase WcaI